ncbi:MAG: transporter substrate-binding domain-containing protein, partial [Desulfobulbaceae bacterium]|nr:transporter substrate-binding domain-containing protein [Desulfobulbaceae bacterium]
MSGTYHLLRGHFTTVESKGFFAPPGRSTKLASGYVVRNSLPVLTSILHKAERALEEGEKQRIFNRWYSPTPQLEGQASVALTARELSWIKAHPKVVLGADAEWRPYVIPNTDGSVSGVEADLFRRIDELTGLNLQIELGKWSEIQEQAKEREIDGLLLSTRQKEREEHFTFSESPYSIYKYIYTKTGAFIPKNMADLSGKKVAYLRGNLFEEKLLKKQKEITAVQADGNEEITSLLLRGEVDAAISGITLRLFYTERMISGVEMAFIAPDSELNLLYSLRKDWPELQSIINKALKAIPLGERLAILEKWGAASASQVASDSFRDSLTDKEKTWLDTRPTIKARESNFPPFLFTDQGKPAGYSVDLLNLIAQRAGLDIQYVSDITWPEGVEHLRRQDGVVDLIPAIMNTQERSEFMAFSRDYIENPFVIFTRDDDDTIHKIEDLIGKTVAIEEGYALVKKIRNAYPGIHLMEVKGVAGAGPEALRAVSLGKADAYIGNLTVTNYHIGHTGLSNLKRVANAPFGFHTHGFGVRKDWPELVSILNKGLNAIPPDERLNILRKWTGFGVAARSETDIFRDSLSDEEKSWLKTHPEVKIGHLENWPPYSFYEAAGQPVGISIDFAELVAKITGIKFKLYPDNVFKTMFEAGKNRQIDVIASMGIQNRKI